MRLENPHSHKFSNGRPPLKIVLFIDIRIILLRNTWLAVVTLLRPEICFPRSQFLVSVINCFVCETNRHLCDLAGLFSKLWGSIGGEYGFPSIWSREWERWEKGPPLSLTACLPCVARPRSQTTADCWSIARGQWSFFNKVLSRRKTLSKPVSGLCLLIRRSVWFHQIRKGIKVIITVRMIFCIGSFYLVN